MPEDTPTDDEDSITNSRQTRWEWLNSLLTGVLVLSLIAILAFTLVTGTSLSVIAQPWFLLYSLAVLMALTWAYGKETLQTVKEVRGK